MQIFNEFFSKNLADIAILAQKRELKKYDRGNFPILRHNGQEFISFACNDYFGLSTKESIKKAGHNALQKYGNGAGASRLLTGDNILYQELEEKLAAFKRTQKALVFGSGYLASLSAIPALVGKNDLVLMDKNCHACHIDGVKLSGAKFYRFLHNNVESCHNFLKLHRHKFTKCIIITETVFSMDGDTAPIGELLSLAKEYQGALMLDDAHGLGFSEKSLNEQNLPLDEHIILLGTLSKACGGYGGYICASSLLIDYLLNKARGFIFSTGLPPAVLAANIAAIDIIANDKSLPYKTIQNANYFCTSMNLSKTKSPIIPIIIGNSKLTLDIASKLYEQGLLVSAIRPPTVAKNSARIRLSFSASHNIDQINKLINALKAIL